MSIQLTATPETRTPVQLTTRFQPANNWVELDGAEYVAVNNLESLEPFFLNIVSSSNQWLYCSSDGALSAGRESPEHALFPYYTVDKIIDNWNSTGPWTGILCEGKPWYPFRPSIALMQPIKRRLMKSLPGDEVVFDELHSELNLRMTYRWELSQHHGFVRTARLTNEGSKATTIRLVDGLDNFLPAGVDQRMQLYYSCLTDAYKLSELENDGQLLVHRLASGIIDEPIPLECLHATTIWSHGLGSGPVCLTRREAQQFLRGNDTTNNGIIRGKRGAYFLARELTLQPGESQEWVIVAEINQSQKQVGQLRDRLANPESLLAEIREDIARGRQKLIDYVASADGFQQTADRDAALYHYQNTLCNLMRGGVPECVHTIKKLPFLNYLALHNPSLVEKYAQLLAGLPDESQRDQFMNHLEQAGDLDLSRLASEFLPLVMSRRHGDPSRPWNRFFIRQKNGENDSLYHFEGNWRDIFQNWEALALSHPGFLPGFISKFLNASTIDGYNPYRITSAGVDWEVIDPDDPWAFIGYWGDHQIIYLLKLLELESKIHPENFTSQLNQPAHVFVDVPYRLKSWEDTLKDPRDTIEFNEDRHQLLLERKKKQGADGFLLTDSTGAIVRATLLEKLLIPALAKLANLIPGGGIWMNTQRPEWNDANNALAGNGLSVVTSAYLYRYFNFLERILQPHETDLYHLSSPLAEFLETLTKLLADKAWRQPDTIDDHERFTLAQDAGRAAQRYRDQVYACAPSASETIHASSLLNFLDLAKQTLKATLLHNRRPDNLWHSYNVLHIDREQSTLGIKFLPLMLEGQVAILTSGLLSSEDAINLLESLPESDLRSQRHPTYLLYPDRQLNRFLEINQVAPSDVEAIPTLRAMAEAGDERILVKDPVCGFRFEPELTNVYALRDLLDKIAREDPLAENLVQDRPAIEQLYENTFHHASFTGRSGTMFSYEGLGCTYWHMISKLMLAAQEAALKAAENDADTANNLFGRLAESYYHVQSGLGFRQSPESYGAFPSEPYSHSPGHGGAQQPGLTGQVKEGIISRFGELGVRFSKGCLSFRPHLLRAAEFSGLSAGPHRPALAKDTLTFTIARTPVTYHRAESLASARAMVHLASGAVVDCPDARLSRELTLSLLNNDEQVVSIDAQIPEHWLVD